MSYLSWWRGLSAQRKNLVYLMGGGALVMLGLVLRSATSMEGWTSGLIMGLGLGGCLTGAVGFLMPDMHDMGTLALRRRYYRDVAIALAGPVLAIAILKQMVNDDALWFRFTEALMPAAIVFLTLLAYLRFIRHADELLRKIELESIAFAVLTVCTASVAVMFLQKASLFEPSSGDVLQAQMLLLAAGYVLARIFVSRRYQ